MDGPGLLYTKFCTVRLRLALRISVVGQVEGAEYLFLVFFRFFVSSAPDLLMEDMDTVAPCWLPWCRMASEGSSFIRARVGCLLLWCSVRACTAVSNIMHEDPLQLPQIAFPSMSVCAACSLSYRHTLWCRHVQVMMKKGSMFGSL